MNYILELIDRDGTFIEHLCTTHDKIERITNPTTYTMNAFKAKLFSKDEIDDMEFSSEISNIIKDQETLIKVVRVFHG